MNGTPLNYHHLRLFWEVARGGSLRVAAEKLNLSQSTISAQIKNLEEVLNKPLFFRTGRGLKLTPAGLLTMEFSAQIFALGSEISRTVQGHGKSANSRLRIGVTDTMPKLVAWRFIRPAMRSLPDLQLNCSEGTTQEMLGLLAAGKLDAVLSDEASPSRMPVKAFNHMLGKSSVVFCATSSLAKRLRKNFPASLNTAAALLPSNRSAWRHQIDRWFEAHSIRPRILAEFDDAALMKTAAADGIGFVPVVATVLDEAKNRYGLLPIQRTMGCDCLFYLIATARATHHPALQAIIQESVGYLSNQPDHIL
jgi:LysR family transcriptional activator of nhaA